MRAMAPPKKLLVRVIVTLVALGVVVLLVGAGWVSSLYQSEQTDEAHASKAFAEVRARFLGLKPALEIQDTQLVIVREPAAPRSATPTVAHVLVWQPRERILSRATLPLWLSKIATEPLPLDALAGIGKQGLGALMDAKRRGNELNIRISDLERYGQTLLLDGVTADGKQILMWNQ